MCDSRMGLGSPSSSVSSSICSHHICCGPVCAYANLLYDFSRKIGSNSRLAFFVSGPERTPNGLRTDAKRTPNGARTDPEQTLHAPRTDSERTSNEARTNPGAPRTNPEQTPNGSPTDPERTLVLLNLLRKPVIFDHRS